MADINFEHIDPWVDGQGDTGLTSRQKLRRNFEKIKAWMDSVASMLSGKYLSKEDDDEAEGVITFKKGSLFGPQGAWGWVKQTVADRVGEGWAWFKNLLADTLEALSALINGNLTVHGGDLTVEEDEQGNGGDAHIGGSLTVDGLTRLFEAIIQNLTVNNNFSVGGTATIHNLIVTGVAHFFKVIIDEIKAAGGALVLTAADGFNVDLVEDITLTLNGRSIAGKRLYWRATDGQRKRSNMWQAGDQALCKTDNLAEGTAYDVNNKYYWAVVAAVSPRPETKTVDGNDAQCHYIDIYCGSGESSIPTDANDVPLWQGEPTTAAAGDEIAMLGSRSADTARQSALYFSAHSSLDVELTAPLLATYRGINDFTLSSHRKTYADALGQKFFGQFFSQATDGDNPTDIEDWLTGSEIKIIYGEGSPLVTRPEQNWTQQDYANYADRCLYYDVSAEPAEDGGRFWKWTMQAGEENPTFSWEHVTDGDTLAALEKIADVASDSKLTGGGEKTRVLLNWKDSREYYTQTIAATPVEMTTSAESCMGSTFAAIYQAAQTAWTALCRYLNGDQAFDGGLQDAPLWISATLDANRVKKETAADPAKWKACLLTTTVLPTLSEVQGETAADSYRRKWSEFYEAMATLAAAQLKWQEKKIDEMGDDGLLDPEEKASLRQIFAAEVKRYFRMLDDFNALGGTSAYYDDTHRLSNIVEEPLNIIATFMDGEGDIEFGAVSSPSGNPQQKGYFEQDGSSYKSTEDTSVVTGKTYYLPEMDLGTLTWQVNTAMRDGLTEEYDTTKAADARSGYPKWLLKANETVSQVVSDDLWDYFWNQYWSAANTMEARLTSAHQKSIDDIAEGLQPQIFIQATAPTNYKAGDHWYQPTTLKNPVTGANVSEDSNGNPIYNHYIAVVENNTLKWKLVNAATTSVFSQLANQIYAAVFDTSNASSLVMRSTSIESAVSRIENGSQNLLLNGHFEDGTNHYAADNGATISTVAQSGLPNSFLHCLKVQTSSGGVRGMSFSVNEQPHIKLKDGESYTFSFWAKADSSKRIRAYRGSTLLGQYTLGTTWTRYGFAVDGDGKSETFYVRDYAAADTVTFYLAGMQLQLGSRTDWADFGGDPVLLKSQITQLADRISLAVFKDEARKAGIDIAYDENTDSGTVTLQGDKVIVDGDLDIKGTVQNSSKLIRYDDTYIAAHVEYPDGQGATEVPATGYVTSGDSSVPYCVFIGAIQMVVPIDFTRTKNVVIKGISGNTSNNTPTTMTHPIVVLPSYTAQSIEGGLQLPAFQKTGVQLHITNSFHVKYRDWVKPATWGSNTDYDIQRAKRSMNAAVLVVADPRLLQYSYHANGVKGFYESLGTDVAMKSVFVCNGVFSKIICLMPGQTLSLVSQIEEWGDSGDKYVVWYVQNASDFTAVTGSLRLTRLNDGTQVTQHIIGFSAGNHYDQLMLLAPPGVTGQFASMPLIDLYLSNGEWPHREFVTENTDTAWS